ncbi:MAG: HNH endonuclease [Candidatus Acidiferrales bacterium]
MKRFPEGVSGGQLREELEREGLKPGDQTHLDRRKRDLKKWFSIEKRVEVLGGRRVTLYRYLGERLQVTDEGGIGIRLRAQVIRAAHGKCEMCGRTIERHEITLVVDHKLPRDWGGTNDRENLWAICEDCNAGKKSYFSSLNVAPELMTTLMKHKSVHVRIGELLKSFGVGRSVPSFLIGEVSGENQDDWIKRLRELRYPVIGWKIDFQRRRTASGKSEVSYILREFKPWPDDPSGVIRRFEKERQQRNRHDSH